MAFDNQGADWLQRDPAVRNVYFGKAMLTCGEVVEIFAAPGGKAGHE
jgi:Cu(I)/Ag(I) efflux system membrane fusion protein